MQQWTAARRPRLRLHRRARRQPALPGPLPGPPHAPSPPPGERRPPVARSRGPSASLDGRPGLGWKPNILGTKGNDVIRVQADEGGPWATVNGRSVKLASDAPLPVIFADQGNDRITYSQDGGGSAIVCAGDGKDHISGGDYSRIHAGDGYDVVDARSTCGWPIEVFGAETVRHSGGFDDPGPCN